MSFDKFFAEVKLDEAITSEQKKQYNDLKKELAVAANKLKAKLKIIPVKVDESRFNVKLGFDSFEVKGIPSLRIHTTYGHFGEDKKELEISQSTADFTKETVKLYADALTELHENYALINDVLAEIEDIKNKFREVNKV